MYEVIEQITHKQKKAGDTEEENIGVISSSALYIYGIVKFGFDQNWKASGLNSENVYSISKGEFSALVHNCKQEPYITKDPEEIKELVIIHNEVLEKAMKIFEGVIPLSLNTIIKNGEDSAEFNLKKWLEEDKERLEEIWNKIKGKKEYGITVYYDKEKLLREVSAHEEVEKIKKSSEEKGQGLSYLLQSKARSKMWEIFQERVIKLKQDFLENIKKITKDIVENPSRISLVEEENLFLRLSVLIEPTEITKLKNLIGKRAGGFSFQIVGPFAPYSFVENGKVKNGK